MLLAECPEERVVLKQSLGKLRVEQEWLSERSRIFREAAALRLLHHLLPAGCVPQVLHEDRENYILIMSAAPPEAKMWKSLLFEGSISTATAGRIGSTLGMIIARTWKSAECESVFGDQTVFDQLRVDPYYRSTALRHPGLAKYFERLIASSKQRRVSLVHGDWSPKNFLVYRDSVTAIDFEVIHFGDPSFDAAFLLNHLLLKSYRFPPWRKGFQSAAREFWSTLMEFVPRECDWFEQAAIEHLGCLLLARIDGKSPAEYITDQETKETIRQAAQRIIVNPPRTVLDVFAC